MSIKKKLLEFVFLSLMLMRPAHANSTEKYYIAFKIIKLETKSSFIA